MVKKIKFDLYRYTGGATGLKAFIKAYLMEPGFNCTFWFRLVSKYPNPFMKLILRKKQIKFGIEIPVGANIGKGFYIGHWGGVIIHPEAVIGENCNISQGVTIGVANGGKKPGVPCIGDRVYIGSGAKVFGGIKIGNDVAIGANAVVNKDVPDGVSVAGIPAKIVSSNGSQAYINRVLND